jgi:fumarylacetoacetase
MTEIDDTHDPRRISWVASANGHPDFPIQNLPLGCFSHGGQPPRGGIAIGDDILDLEALAHARLLTGDAQRAVEIAGRSSLNSFLALGPGPRTLLRRAVSALLDSRSRPHPDLLRPAADCTMHLPAAIGDYTDFYAGIQHATNVGRMLRPDAPLGPNYKYVPIGYHGRASSIVASGTDVRRPNGQRKPARDPQPSFGPSRNLDYELELGIWIGPGNPLGTPIPVAEAADHIAGFCLLNDWSARDIQGWEYQPLGPFLAKSFASTISPWIITPEAMAPFRLPQDPRASGDPAPLDYLFDPADQAGGALNLTLEVTLNTPGLRAKGLPPHRMSIGEARHMYWTPAQLVAHHASAGCNLRPGDLFGTGTLSGPTPTSAGSLLEISQGGRNPLELESGEVRRFLEDGDTIRLYARANRAGYVSIGFGPCAGTIVPALA